ncbi:Norsolorinic acid ketoreductase, partial [Leucoagaricus sp. SymC.cos]
GLALVTELVKTKYDVHIFAAARTPSAALNELETKHPDKVSIVHFVAADEASNKAAAKIVGDRFGRVDTVLAVAGAFSISVTVKSPHPRSHIKPLTGLQINVTGVLTLFQTFIPLLQKSKAPKFIPFTSAVASLTAYIDLPAGYACYGTSKVALNYLARRIHFENKWITCFPLSPGIVKTDMAIACRTMDKTGTLAPIQDAMAMEPDVAAKMLVDIVEGATRDAQGGEFINIDGQKVPW